jgi:predicted transcriptional regulator
MSDVLHLEIRKKIYKLLLLNPGLNLSKIAELLNISIPLADYHLYFLEENGLITIEKEGGYKRYYVKGEIGVEEKKILSLLQQEIPLQIVLVLLKLPGSKPKDIREHLGLSPALLAYYLKKLVKYGMITETVSEEKNQYVVTKEQDVMKLLISYKSNVLLQRFKDTWTVDFPLSSKIKKEKKEESETES